VAAGKRRVVRRGEKKMQNPFIKNCCDGLYNSFDVHFTSACDNKCAHCIDTRFHGVGAAVPNVPEIVNTIVENCNGYDDVLFLGGEPCLFLEELVSCVKELKSKTKLKLFVTTAIPKTCFDNKALFLELVSLLDGINLSVQSHDETVADKIRKTKSKYDRQSFYASLPKEKVRINLNIVKPYLYTRADISNCIRHYDSMGFKEIKLSEIQHGKDCFVSFEKTFNIKLPSPFYGGCQSFVELKDIIPGIKAKLLLKRSCFMCEKTLQASFMDGIKGLYKIFAPARNMYGVIYANGTLSKGWV
jgi:organic radical activating enzyme